MAQVQTYEVNEVRLANRTLNNHEFEQRRTVLRSLPLVLFLELTKNCNLFCPMCRPRQKFDAGLNMPFELFERIADELFSTAMMVDLRGWGESAMLKNFDRFIRLASSYRPQLRLVTNAQIDRKQVWDLLMAAHGIVVVSCDAASDDLFAKLRAGGTLQRLKRCVTNLVRSRDEHGAPRESVLLTAVASPHNLHELDELVSLTAQLDLPKIIFFPVQDNHGTWAMDANEDEIEAAYRRAFDRGRQEGVTVQLGAAPTEGLAMPALVKQVPCMHPWSYAYVDYRGWLGFCDHLIGESKYVFDSLYRRSFDEIWNGPDFQQLRGAHAAGDIPDRFHDCRWCYRQRYVDFEDKFYAGYGPRRVATDARSILLPIRPVASHGSRG
jgi:MoaA/NifB/PqqE/SkfB family radical SAM enzyme